MQGRGRRRRRGGRAVGVVAAACYLLAAGCLAGAAWLGLDYLDGDEEPSTSTAAVTAYTTTTDRATPRLPANAPGTGSTTLPTGGGPPPEIADSDRNGNRRPTIVGPPRLAVAVGSTVTPSGLVVDDEEAGADGSLLLLLVGVGVDLAVDLEGGARFTGPAAAQWMPMIGTIEDLNRTLATLAITRTAEEAVILVYVDDTGNGDPDRAEQDEFHIDIRNP